MAGKYQAYPEYKDSGIEWLGDTPQHWDIFDGKRVFNNRRELALPTDDQLAASQKYGVVPQSLMMELNDSKVMLALKGTNSFRHVEKNDFVISLRSFEGGIEHSTYLGCVSPAYTVLYAIKDISPSFYRYLFKSRPYISALQATTDSLRDGKSITYEQFGAIPLILPKVEEQENIAKFLDYETAKIDALIDKQQQLIKLLKEKRQAVISHAVTKGLNPNVSMRDSGIEWLGMVPEHWLIKKLKYLGVARNGLTYSPDDIVGSDEGVLVLRSSNVQNMRITFEDNVFVKKNIQERMITKVNDILICSRNGSRALIGKNALIDDESAGHAYGAFMMIYRSEINPYLFCVFNSTLFEYQSGTFLTSTINQLTVENIDGFEIPLPPIDEQEEIIINIKCKTQVIDNLIVKANSLIELIKERRAALISAAVTGKIDVRNWQAPASFLN
jgi:type I restriction enzyme, S subunit